PGSLAHVEPRGGPRCTARVLGALPQVDAATRSRRVRLVPDDGCKGLVPGAQAEVEIEVPVTASSDAGVEQVLVVPAAALVELKSATIAFVKAREAGVFDVRAVEPGLRVGED